MQNIEFEINSIFNTLVSNASEGAIVIKERPQRGSSCKGIISVYRRDELNLQHADAKLTAADLDGRKRYRALPMLRYAFYPSVTAPGHIGSVAIYGENAMVQYVTLQRTRTLFGRKVAAATIEIGIRPFVDVAFAA